MKANTLPSLITTTGVDKVSTTSNYEDKFEYGKSIEQIDYDVQIRNKPTIPSQPTESELKTMLTATDADVQSATGTDYITAAQGAFLLDDYGAGTTTTIVSSAGASIGSSSSTTPQTLKTFTMSIKKAGTVTVAFTLTVTRDGGGPILGGVNINTAYFVNGSQVGATQTWNTTSGATTNYTKDLTFFSGQVPSPVITLRYWKDSGLDDYRGEISAATVKCTLTPVSPISGTAS